MLLLIAIETIAEIKNDVKSTLVSVSLRVELSCKFASSDANWLSIARVGHGSDDGTVSAESQRSRPVSDSVAFSTTLQARRPGAKTAVLPNLFFRCCARPPVLASIGIGTRVKLAIIKHSSKTKQKIIT